MAKFKAFSSTDIHEAPRLQGDQFVARVNASVMVINEYGDIISYYGDYKFSNWEWWSGTVKRVVFNRDGDDLWEAKGVKFDLSLVRIDQNRAEAFPVMFKGDDTHVGSGGKDTLDGFNGDDLVQGKGGADRLLGGGGLDTLEGGGGNDRLEGAGGKDRLDGGTENDKLFGGGGGDDFVFRKNSARDTIQDWESGKDRMVIENGANDFDDLKIKQNGADAIVKFAQTTVVILNTKANDIDEDDFLFG